MAVDQDADATQCPDDHPEAEAAGNRYFNHGFAILQIQGQRLSAASSSWLRIWMNLRKQVLKEQVRACVYFKNGR